MARTSVLEDLVEITSRIPWLLAASIGGGLFYFFKYYMPLQVSGTFAPMFSALAYVSLGACLLGALIGLFRRIGEYLVFKSQRSINSVRSLSWSDFERMVTEAFRQRGYQARRSPSGPDGGVDIVLEQGNQTTLVQCKQWKKSRVGVKPVRELAGVVAAQKASGGIFVCSGDYTSEAVELAKKSHIDLIDGRRLADLMEFTPSKPPTEVHLSLTTSFDCPECGSNLVRRVARRGKNVGSEFLGCSAFPKCRYTRSD
jgi:restriction system protein